MTTMPQRPEFQVWLNFLANCENHPRRRKNSPSIDLFNKLNWLPFSKQSYIKRNALAYKRISDNHKTPGYIDEVLPKNSSLHDRVTRYSNLNCPKYKRKTEGGRTYTIRTITEWNSLSIQIRKSGSLSSFKRCLYQKLLTDQKAANKLNIWTF
jgi:hypothetical protein